MAKRYVYSFKYLSKVSPFFDQYLGLKACCCGDMMLWQILLTRTAVGPEGGGVAIIVSAVVKDSHGCGVRGRAYLLLETAVKALMVVRRNGGWLQPLVDVEASRGDGRLLFVVAGVGGGIAAAGAAIRVLNQLVL